MVCNACACELTCTANSDTAMQRVHSAISLVGLADAMSDDEGTVFKMDRMEEHETAD